MTVQQLSVFIENKAGTLQKVLNLLKEAGIQLIASTIADTVEYGIYRIILLGNKGILIFRTDNPDRAREVIILNNLSFVAEKDLSTLI